ncbi:hypothetical protein E3N88_37869 [Mikania micrantha]|uniref:Uncharacterized protein n=1 Tax=Mikania micrantha TaxID=192012 RepID=A0A5N6LUP6_9ASTR|nr:hypothetical protein E3N88_37869 [Mikania micrantha]
MLESTQHKKKIWEISWKNKSWNFELCARCPQHGITEHQLLHYFCEGLAPMERRLINASSGGALLDKTPTQIRALITSIAEDSKHSNQEEDWYPDVRRAVKEVITPHIETEIAELKKMVMQLTKDKGVEPQGQACGICLQLDTPQICVLCCKKIWNTHKKWEDFKDKIQGSILEVIRIGDLPT